MTIAPHAYSSDTLQKAYKWLQNYPEYQKNIKNSDQLVALYLSEKKGLQSFNSRPVSAINFDKLEIDKNNFDQSKFDKNKKIKIFNCQSDLQKDTSSLFVLDKKVVNKMDEVKEAASSLGGANSLGAASSLGGANSLEAASSLGGANSLEAASSLGGANSTKVLDNLDSLDKKTLSFLDNTIKTFNLSSRSEALRLLVSIGYEKLYKI